VTSSTPEAETVKGSAARAKRKSVGGGGVRQSDPDAATGGVLGCYGNSRMTSPGVVKDEKDDGLNSSSSVTSLRELELAAAAGRTSNGKLDNVKARLTH